MAATRSTTSSSRSTSTARTSTARSAAAAKSPKAAKTTGKYISKIDVAHPPKGMNPALAGKVRAIGLTTDKALQPGYPTKGTTHCNQAVDKYAKQFGYSGFKGLNADKMNKLMSNPKSGWHKISQTEAIAAAKAGKLTVASVPASAKHAHGHIAAVTGEWAPGVAGISQAGTNNYEFGTWRRESPSFFTRD